MGSEKLTATYGKLIRLSEELAFPSSFSQHVEDKEGLLIYSKEHKQVLMFPIKTGKSVVRIWVVLEELNTSFQKELISDLTDYGLTDIWVAGIKSAALDSNNLVYEGFFQTDQDLDIKHLKRNIEAIGDVLEVKIDLISKS